MNYNGFCRASLWWDLPLVTLMQSYVVGADVVVGFRTYLLALRRSPATVAAYLAAVARWQAFAGLDGLGDTDPLLRFLAWRRKRVGPASVNLDISALRTWFRWLAVTSPDALQPRHWPKLRRPPRRIVRAFDDAQVGALLAQPDLTTFTGLRDHMVMATLYQCGLRASELVTLELGSVRLDGLLYVRGKGGKDRLVPFGGAWHGLLESYLRRRATTGCGKRAALFVTRHGRPLRNGRSVWVIVNRYARRRLGLDYGFARLQCNARGKPWQGHYPHMLRAAFATELHRRGVNLMAIAQLLGHADVATTQHYLGVDIEQLRKAAARHPRAVRGGKDTHA